MSFKIHFYQTESHKPLQDFINTLSKPTKSKIIRSVELLESYGVQVGMPHVKKIDKNLYELRIRGTEEVRILFTKEKDQIYLLHGFRKKKMKIPSKEIVTAKNRILDLTII